MIYEFKGRSLCITQYFCSLCDEYVFDNFDYAIPDSKQMCHINAVNREGFNVFKYIIDDYQFHTFLLSAQIKVEEDKNAILCVTNLGKSKVWFNSKFLFANVSKYGVVRRIPITLKKGLNTILILQNNPSGNDIVNVTLLDEDFERSNDVTSLSSSLYNFVLSQLILIQDPEVCIDKSNFKFSYIQSKNTFENNYKVEIYNWKYEVIDEFYSEFKKVNIVNLDRYRISDVDFQHLWFKCTFYHDEEEISTGPVAFINDFTNANNKLNQILIDKAENSSGLLKTTILGKLRKQKLYSDMNLVNMIYWESYKNKELLDSYKTNSDFEDSLYKPGVHEVYIKSEIDGSYIRIGVSVPKNYDNKISYPAIFAIATSNENGFTAFAKELNLDSRLFIIDVTGRGYTGGSYIGEASILEVIEWTKKMYRIDDKQIFGLGYSNGGTALFAIAQNHPDLFAGIFPLAGICNQLQQNNLSNTNVIQLISNLDYVNEIYDNVIPDSINFQMGDLLHIYLGDYLYNKRIIEILTASHKKAYPTNIKFTTYRNRHLKSYWVSLLGVDDNCEFAKCNVHVNANIINIELLNCKGIDIQLPPYVNRNSFSIILNGQTIHVERYNKERIQIIKKNELWEVGSKECIYSLYKGTGLLDVYCNSMSIVLSSNSSRTMIDTAERLSMPKSNGLDPKVDVKYPIEIESPLSFKKNLIMINSYINNEIYDDFIKDLSIQKKVKCYSYGYIIGEEKVFSDYVVMQIINNPKAKGNSILLIETNNDKLLASHILLRKVIIPTYINGLHPYWNKEIVIFDGKEYILL